VVQERGELQRPIPRCSLTYPLEPRLHAAPVLCPRLHFERLPAYAPQLNPDEQVWGQAKGALANGRPDNLDELICKVTRILTGLKPSLR
jgi:hypothetical protein